MITVQEAKFIMAESLESFYRHNETLNLQQLQAECINNACIYYLKKTNNSFFDPIANIIADNPMLVGQTFGQATQQIVPQFTDAMVANSGIAVLQNSQWDGIEEFLKNYFLKVHKQNISI